MLWSNNVLHSRSIQPHTAVSLLEEMDTSLDDWLIEPFLELSMTDGIRFLPPECRAAYEPRKKNNSYFPLNPGCLRMGSLFHGLWNNPYNPHITEVSCPIYTKQPGALFSLHKLRFEAPQENTMIFKDRSSLSSNSSVQALTSSYGKKKVTCCIYVTNKTHP